MEKLKLIFRIVIGSFLSFLIYKVFRNKYVEASPPKAAHIFFNYLEADGKMVRIVNSKSVKAGKKLSLILTFSDEFGNPGAAIDGKPVFSLGDESLGSLSPNENGLQAVFTSVGKVGEVACEAIADADPSSKFKGIVGQIKIVVIPSDAVSVNLVAEEVVEEVPAEEVVPEPEVG